MAWTITPSLEFINALLDGILAGTFPVEVCAPRTVQQEKISNDQVDVKLVREDNICASHKMRDEKYCICR